MNKQKERNKIVLSLYCNGYLFDKKYFCLKVLRFSTRCVKLFSVDRPAHRKETQASDLYGRRILHTRRNSNYSQSHRRYGYQALEEKQDARLQVRRFVESEQKRVLGICSQAEKYPGQEIKKAGFNQQSTIEIVAVRSRAAPCKSVANDPNTSYKQCAYIQYRQWCQPLSRHKYALCNPLDALVASKERVPCIFVFPIFVLSPFYRHTYFHL